MVCFCLLGMRVVVVLDWCGRGLRGVIPEELVVFPCHWEQVYAVWCARGLGRLTRLVEQVAFPGHQRLGAVLSGHAHGTGLRG